jgi:hypothetical protein
LILVVRMTKLGRWIRLQKWAKRKHQNPGKRL